YLVFHGLANAVAIGRAGKTFRLQIMAVLDHVDPGAGRQADGVDAGLGRSLEAGKTGKSAVLWRALGWSWKPGFCRRDQRERHSRRGNGRQFGAGGEFDA